MEGDSRAVVVGFPFPRHRSRPPVLEPSLVEQVALEHYLVPGDEAAPCVLGYLFGSAAAVQYNLREDIISPAAHPEIQVVANLAGDDGGIGPLGCKDEVDTKGPPLPYIMEREIFLGELAHLDIAAAQLGKSFDEHRRDVPGLNSGYHLLKTGPFHGDVCDPVIHKNKVSVLVCLLQNLFLERDLSRGGTFSILPTK